jgi:hypothetical protein
MVLVTTAEVVLRMEAVTTGDKFAEFTNKKNPSRIRQGAVEGDQWGIVVNNAITGFID